MKKIAFGLLLFLIATAAAQGQDCTGKPRLSISAATRRAAVDFPGAFPDTIQSGDPVTLVIGGRSIPAIAKRRPDVGFSVNTIDLETKAPIDNSPSAGYTSGDASLQAKDGTVIQLCSLTALNYSFHAGPTVAVDNGSSNADAAGVIRFQFAKGFLRTIPVRSDPRLIPSMRNMTEEFSVSIDTTDRQPPGTQFIDDNRVRAALRSPEFTFGPSMQGVQAFNRFRVGVEGEFARAIHSADRNRDLTVVVDGWLPFFQTLNLFSTGRTVSLPLRFRISAGHRMQQVAGTRSGGRLADASVTYTFYALDHYAVDLSAKTLFDDAADRPATTPRTQHSYKAQVSYHADPLSKFSVVTSFENGHSGPVFTKLRQFFVGIGIEQLFGAAH